MLQPFKESALSAEGKILVKFGAPWCAPCKVVGPVLEKLSDEGFTIYDVNTDEDPDSAGKYSIRSVPTFIVFENGSEITRKTGQMTKPELIELFK